MRSLTKLRQIFGHKCTACPVASLSMTMACRCSPPSGTQQSKYCYVESVPRSTCKLSMCHARMTASGAVTMTCALVHPLQSQSRVMPATPEHQQDYCYKACEAGRQALTRTDNCRQVRMCFESHFWVRHCDQWWQHAPHRHLCKQRQVVYLAMCFNPSSHRSQPGDRDHGCN